MKLCSSGTSCATRFLEPEVRHAKSERHRSVKTMYVVIVVEPQLLNLSSETQFVKRIVQHQTYDPEVVNVSS